MHHPRCVIVIAAVAVFLGSFARPACSQVARTACDSVLELLPDFPGLVVSSQDTLATDVFTGQRLPGCWVWITGPSENMSFGDNPHSILRKRLPQAGWQEAWERMADGPDVTIFGMRKDSLLCLLRARWDGGDDSDPDYVPENRYELVVSCFEEHG